MKIGIIGLGLIGGTIAKSLNKNNTISAYDISEDVLSYALSEKIIHKAYNDLETFLNENPVIYMCLYPTQVVDFFEEYIGMIKKDTLFIEITGIKSYLVNTLSNLTNKNFDIVFTHPVAGSEKVGVKYSDAKIFQNANYVITPVKDNLLENIELTEKLAREMGFLNITKISPEEHDDIIAYTSQLTHIISMSLVSSLDSNLNTKKFIGDSYKDLTRIAEINEALWNGLFLNNREALLHKIKNFKTKLEEFEQAIDNNDSETLNKLMIEARLTKTDINKG